MTSCPILCGEQAVAHQSALAARFLGETGIEGIDLGAPTEV